MTFASAFSITYYKHFKVVKNLKEDKTYILRICGSDVPTKYPNGTAIESDAKHFSVPVKGAAIGWSTPYAAFELLGLEDKVKVVDPQYVHSPCLRQKEKAGEITSQGSGSSRYYWNNQWYCTSPPCYNHSDGWLAVTRDNADVSMHGSAEKKPRTPTPELERRTGKRHNKGPSKTPFRDLNFNATFRNVTKVLKLMRPFKLIVVYWFT